MACAEASVMSMVSVAVFLDGREIDDVMALLVVPFSSLTVVLVTGNRVTVSTDSCVAPNFAFALLVISRILKVTSVTLVTVTSAAV